MKPTVILDTGPLVALLDRRDKYHEWAKARLGELRPPLLTCASVLSEAIFLLRNVPRGAPAVLELLRRQVATVAFRLNEEVTRVSKLLTRYANIPMSLADACLVRMSEQHAEGVVLTLDSDFRIYRKHGRQAVPHIIPDDL